ncbi:hypothetical protein [Sphingobium sp.]|uniref:hypothetical protein n=1 Tax=Sphingobium sp. TaxID=1912891 RepID=UPI002E1A08AA
MSEEDLSTLQIMAQGDGEMRLSKRLMRALLARLKLDEATRRAQDMVGRNLRTPA